MQNTFYKTMRKEVYTWAKNRERETQDATLITCDDSHISE